MLADALSVCLNVGGAVASAVVTELAALGPCGVDAARLLSELVIAGLDWSESVTRVDTLPAPRSVGGVLSLATKLGASFSKPERGCSEAGSDRLRF